MAKSKKKSESTHSNTPRKVRRRNRIKILLILLLEYLGVNILLAVFSYARSQNTISAFWESIVKYTEIIILGYFTINALNRIFQNKIPHKKKTSRFFIFSSIFIILLFTISFYALANIEMRINQKSEERTTKSSIVKNNIRNFSYDYDIETDPFIEKNSLSYYLGATNCKQTIINSKITIIQNSLQKNSLDENISKTYIKYTEIADFDYNTYLYQKSLDSNRDYQILFDRRIEALKRCIYERESANRECKTITNMQLIASAYKDLADEYVEIENQDDAFLYYEEAATWCIKSCYYALQEEYMKYDNCMKVFRNIDCEQKKLTAIGNKRKKRISEMLLVYEALEKIEMGEYE